MSSASTVRDASDRAGRLLADLAAVSDAAARDTAEELARTIVELYGDGLERIVAMLAARPGGDQLIRTLAADGLVGDLFVLHDLHPVPVADRVRMALEAVRPHLGSRTVEFLGIDSLGTAQVALGGNDGCRSSAATLTGVIERSVLDAAPELAGVHVDTGGGGPALLQIQPYRAHAAQP